MSEDLMDYQSLVERAMRSVVREALLQVGKDGLPGDHHLYITFRTEAPGVEIASRLAAQYPEEMTIVLQHQFWGLEIGDEAFEITLSFSGRNERLLIPFDAITGFVDPSVNFGLQFKAAVIDEDDGTEADDGASGRAEDAGDPAAAGEAADGADDGAGAPKTGEVVALDAFRKKKT